MIVMNDVSRGRLSCSLYAHQFREGEHRLRDNSALPRSKNVAEAEVRQASALNDEVFTSIILAHGGFNRWRHHKMTLQLLDDNHSGEEAFVGELSDTRRGFVIVIEVIAFARAGEFRIQCLHARQRWITILMITKE